MKPVEGKVADWHPPFRDNVDPASRDIDAAPFDSAPGLGFDTDPVAAGILPPAGEVTGSGAALALSPAQNNTFRAVNRAWREGGRVRFHQGRYVVTGLSDRVARELHLRAERAGRCYSSPREFFGFILGPGSRCRVNKQPRRYFSREA